MVGLGAAPGDLGTQGADTDPGRLVGPCSMEGKRFVDLSKDEDFPHELDPLDGELDPGLPSTEDVILKTEQVTKNIQELLRAAQESKHDRWDWGTASGSFWTPRPGMVPCLVTLHGQEPLSSTLLTFSPHPQLCALLREDPLGCDRDGITLP